MTIIQDKKDHVLSKCTSLQSAASIELAEIGANVRWFTTLAMASIAALAGYRQLQGAQSLSPAFALLVLLFCVSLMLFLFSVFFTQYAHQMVRKKAARLIDRVHELDLDESIAPAGADNEIENLVEDLRIITTKSSLLPENLELLGLVFFIISAALAAPTILFTEFVKALFY